MNCFNSIFYKTFFNFQTSSQFLNFQTLFFKLKTEANSVEEQLHAKRLQNEQFQQKYKANKDYQKLLNLREELKVEVVKNSSILQFMSDPSFANPSKELEELYKRSEIEKHKLRINQLFQKNKKN